MPLRKPSLFVASSFSRSSCSRALSQEQPGRVSSSSAEDAEDEVGEGQPKESRAGLPHPVWASQSMVMRERGAAKCDLIFDQPGDMDCDKAELQVPVWM